MTDAVVVDASLATKWVAPEPYTAEAIELLAEWRENGWRRLVPAWFAAEMSNVLYRKGLAAGAPLWDTVNGLHRVMAVVTVSELDAASVARGIQIADSLNRPATYDSLYAALAERESCELWTADERFWNAARTTYPWVRWIGERAVGGEERGDRDTG